MIAEPNLTPKSSYRISRRQFLQLAWIGAAGFLVANYPIFIERYWIQTNLYRIPVPNLPSAFHGFRMVHLSDFHFGFLMPEAIIKWVIWRANHLQADMIVSTGDYVHKRNSTSQIDTIWPILSQLSAPEGVYAVLGNHDHWADRDRSLYWLDRSGQNLHHRAVPLTRGNENFWLGGAGDAWEDEDGIDQAFEHVPPGECKILLAHNPDTADFNFETRIDLILSGHTHGGQVNLPWIGTPVLPVKNKRYASGLVKTGNSHIFISKGIGWAVLPVRFNCPPEIAVLELVPTTEKQK